MPISVVLDIADLELISGRSIFHSTGHWQNTAMAPIYNMQHHHIVFRSPTGLCQPSVIYDNDVPEYMAAFTLVND